MTKQLKTLVLGSACLLGLLTEANAAGVYRIPTNQLTKAFCQYSSPSFRTVGTAFHHWNSPHKLKRRLLSSNFSKPSWSSKHPTWVETLSGLAIGVAFTTSRFGHHIDNDTFWASALCEGKSAIETEGRDPTVLLTSVSNEEDSI